MAQPIIKLKYIPALFPNVNFQSEHYINSYRVVKDPESEVKLIYSEPYKVVDNLVTTIPQIIQTQVYDRYKVFINFNESFDISNIQVAGEVLIITEYDKTITARVTDFNKRQIADTWQYKLELTFFSIQPDEISISNHLTSVNLRSSENGKYADTALNKFTLTVNPLWGAADAYGTVNFPSGFDYSADNKDFKISYKTGSQKTITLTSNCADMDAIVTHLNSLLTAQSITAVQAYNDGRRLMFRTNKTGYRTPEYFQIYTGVTDDFLVQAGFSATVYTGNNPIDSTLEAEANSLDFYTKIEPVKVEETSEDIKEIVDGIEIPVYTNKFRSITLDLFLDDYTAKYGTFTELEAFDYYTGQTWYVDVNGSAAGEVALIRNTDTYTALESVEVERIENDDLIDCGHRRIKLRYTHLQNYRFRVG